jgi:hypothetical protein
VAVAAAVADDVHSIDRQSIRTSEVKYVIRIDVVNSAGLFDRIIRLVFAEAAAVSVCETIRNIDRIGFAASAIKQERKNDERMPAQIEGGNAAEPTFARIKKKTKKFVRTNERCALKTKLRKSSLPFSIQKLR